MKETVIILDAGHGGLDASGKYTTAPAKMTKHKDGWFYEGVSNRNIATQLIQKLTEKGFIVAPVFHPYKDTPLITRTNLANSIADSLQAPTVYLSIHSNAISSDHSPQDTARGLTVWTYNDKGTAYEIGKSTGESIKEVFEAHGSRRHRTMYQAKFHVLIHTKMPAILYEFGFFDHALDKDLLKNPFFIDEITEALANSLSKLLQ